MNGKEKLFIGLKILWTQGRNSCIEKVEESIIDTIEFVRNNVDDLVNQCTGCDRRECLIK